MIRLIPRETKFFRMFAEVSQNVTEGARLLQDILKNPANMGERLGRLQEIEHRGDDMTHAIITTLNQTFITPFDREDIHRLTSSLDDVLDLCQFGRDAAHAVPDRLPRRRWRRSWRD